MYCSTEFIPHKRLFTQGGFVFSLLPGIKYKPQVWSESPNTNRSELQQVPSTSVLQS